MVPALAHLRRLSRTAELVLRLTETWFRRPRAPTRLVLDVTRRCNLRCRMCRTWRVTPRHELTPQEVGSLVGGMPGLTWLDVTGGEPLLRRDVLEVFDAILGRTPALRVLHFQTNGWLERRAVELCERIVSRRPEARLIVTLTIDDQPAVHDDVRGRAGSFERALSTFLALRAMEGVEVYVGTTVTPFNAEAVEDLGLELERRVPGFEPTEWHWNWMQISSHFFDNADLADLPDVPADGLVRRHLRRRGLPRSLVELMELVFLVNLEHYRRGEPSGVVCQALRSAAFVSPEGDLHPCHVWNRPLGNVRDRDVRALWGSPEVRRARGQAERLECGGCFTPCEAYPALAGAPLATARVTLRRAAGLLRPSPPSPPARRGRRSLPVLSEVRP